MRVELPPGPAHFVNRDDEREQASRAVEEWAAERSSRARPLVLALSGPAGLGKTELARLLARTVVDGFCQDALSVDLDDFRADGVLDPADVLAQLLRSLGVPSDLVEVQFKARCRQYWSMTAEARLVLVVDNARYASELVPLLPASGRSVVIVASHGPLDDLEDGAATGMKLPPLDEREATRLLELIVRDRRLAADPEAVRALVRLCEGLPAALHVAGRWVRTHRLRPLSRLIPELRAELNERGVSGVEAFWDLEYGRLSRSAALLYRLLPHHPGTTVTLASATALLGLGEGTCQEALEELYAAGLLDLRAELAAEDERMRLGPLRAHALRRSRQDAEEGEVARAQQRVLRWFVRQAQRADRYAAGRRLVVSDTFPEVPDAPDVPLEDPEETGDGEERAARAERASTWLFEERHALLECARVAHGREWDAEVVALSEPVWTYALDHPHQVATLQVFRLAVDAAVRNAQGGPNAAGLVRTRCQLARHLWESGALVEAGVQLDAAEAAVGLLTDSERDRKLAVSVIEFRGMLHGAHGDWRAAAAHFARCREAHLAVPNPYGAVLMTYRAGEARAKLGELDAARELLAAAHAEVVGMGRQRMIGRTAFALAGVLRRLGSADEARPLYERALHGAERRRSSFDQARVHDAMAELHEAEGHGADAERHRAAALDIRRHNGLA